MLSRLRLVRLYERLDLRSVAVDGGSITMTMFKSHTRAPQSLCFSLPVVLFAVSELHAATCESLQTLSLPNTTITLAQSVAAGAFSSPDAGRPGAPPTADFKQLPAFCRVTATLRPSTDSDIKIEVWLPQANWNGKFQGAGNGGLAGSIVSTSGSGGVERGMAEALNRGCATASTDTGHTGNTAAPFLGHPEKLVDFADRAVHEMTVTAKSILAALGFSRFGHPIGVSSAVPLTTRAPRRVQMRRDPEEEVGVTISPRETRVSVPPDLQQVYGEFHRRTQRYLTRLLGPSEADDVTREVFARVRGR